MDLTSITHQKLLQQLSRTSQISPWLDINKLPTGSRLIAVVEKVARVDNSLQQKLLTYTNTAANTSTHAKQNASALIQKPELYLAQLTTLGKKIMAFTELELLPKQQVPVLIKKDGQLFIEATKASHLNQSHLKSGEQSVREQNNKNSQTPSSLTHTDHVKSSQKNIISNSLNIQTNTLTNGLKQYLPIQKNMAEVFSTLRLLEKIQNSTLLKKDLSFLSPITTKTLPLLNKAPQISQLNHSHALATQIKNSGIFFEHKLAALRTKEALQSNTISSAKNDIKNTPVIDRNILRDDTKADILRSIDALTQLSATLNTQPQKANAISNSAFDKLMQSVFNIATPKNSSANSSVITKQYAQQQIIDKLRPLLFASLARLTTMQIQHLMHRQNESASVNSGGLFEFPVRINDEFFPLTLHIQERFYQEKQQQGDVKKKQEKATIQKKRWHVFMEFDLQELGSFASDISVSDKTVRTTLWVEKKALWTKSKHGLKLLQEEMEKNGISVEEIQCIQGSPPEKPMQLHHTLIDVKT